MMAKAECEAVVLAKEFQFAWRELDHGSEFIESLRLLVEREQYAASDIALMFCVSRERVRQWIKRYNLRTTPKVSGMRAVRIWNDAENTFHPHSRSAHNRSVHKMSVAARKSAFAEKLANRRALMATAIRAAYLDAGRPLTAQEMYFSYTGKQVGPAYAYNNMASHWSPNRHQKKLKAGAILEEIAAAAGITLRRAGQPLNPYHPTAMPVPNRNAMIVCQGCGTIFFGISGTRQCQTCEPAPVEIRPTFTTSDVDWLLAALEDPYTDQAADFLARLRSAIKGV